MTTQPQIQSRPIEVWVVPAEDLGGSAAAYLPRRGVALMADRGQPWSRTHRLVDDRGEFFAATCTCGWYSPERADPDEVEDERDLHDALHADELAAVS